MEPDIDSPERLVPGRMTPAAAEPGARRDPTRRRDWLAAWAVFAFALLLRLVYLAEVADIPFLEFPIVDARAYDEWAQRIVAGSWWGEEVFYQAPAYPYFLAVLYSLLGRDLWTVHLLQMGMGALSCVLMFLGTRALFGWGAGLAAGLMLALYPPAIFFDGLIGKAGLGLLLTSALLGLLLAFQRRNAGWICAASGAVLGLLALTRENALALVPAVAIWLLIRFRDRPAADRARWLAAFALGLVVVLLPVGVRNYVVGDTFALTTSQMGTNFYMGNSEEATGLYVPLIPGRHTPVYEASDAARIAERELGRSLTRGEVSSYWMGRALEFVREQPLRWLELMALKVALSWNEFEIADSEDIHVYAEWSHLLSWLLSFFHFGVLAPLAAAGVALAWGERREIALLGWLALVYTASVALFITFARFRFPLVPMLVPLAALAVVRAGELFWAGRPRELVTPGLCLLIAAALCNLPLLDEERFLLASHVNLGGIMLNHDRPAQAEPHLQRAFEIDSENPDLLFHMGVLRYKQGRLAEAERHLLKMCELRKGDHRGHRLLARIYRQTGRRREAIREARIAFELDPDTAGRGRRIERPSTRWSPRDPGE